MEKVTKKRFTEFQNYVATYDLKKHGCNGKKNVVIDDIIYGLGVAIGGKENEFSDGFKKFKKELYDKFKAEFQ